MKLFNLTVAPALLGVCLSLSFCLHTNAQSGQKEKSTTCLSGLPLTVPPSTLPNTYYYTDRPVVAPRNGTPATLNPPTLNWPSAKKTTATFDVELSPVANFSGNQTLRRRDIGYTVYTFSKQLKPGTWYWRYAINLDGKKTWSDTYQFIITKDTPVFVPPTTEQLVKNLTRPHTVVLTYGVNPIDVGIYAEKFPQLRDSIIKKADAIVKKEIIDFATYDRSHLTDRNFGRMQGKQINLLSTLAQAYLLTGDKKYCTNAVDRINEALTWPTLTYANDMMYAGFIRHLGETHDTYGKALPEGFDKKILTKIAGFLEHQYRHWQGKVENRQLDNHFWQVEISGYFYTAVATLSALPENKKYIDHAYHLFLGRAPVCGGNGGGWANGLAYFSVNTSTLGDMAYFLHKVGGIPLFKKPWYQKLPDYYIQCGPAGAPSSGFGDMHDRLGNSGQGSLLPYLALAEPNAKTLWHLDRISAVANQRKKKNQKPQHPWLMLLHNIKKLTAKDTFTASDLPQQMLFPEIGVVAMHNDVSKPESDTSLYFRSSPYGAFGHMHANQNAFNLVHDAEKIFYSAGYYTSFADPHSVTSYRHTRAQNSMLINGRGQAFGHQGYGFIKRYASNSKIVYTCGEAAMAYRPLEDKMWSKLVQQSYTQAGIDPAKDFGDGKLNSYERHIAFLRPNVVVIYDVIDAKEPVTAQFLLQSPHKIAKNSASNVTISTSNSLVNAKLFCSGSTSLGITDNAFIAPVDHLQKYGKGALKKQYHLSYATSDKSSKIRFLSIIHIGENDGQPKPTEIVAGDDGSITVGDYKISAELDINKPARLHATCPDAELQVNDILATVLGKATPKSTLPSTLLSEKKSGKTTHCLTSNTAPTIAE